MSVKQLHYASADKWEFYSDYFVPEVDIERFKSDIHWKVSNLKDSNMVNCPGSNCAETWMAAHPVEEYAIKAFVQTDIFVIACRHGFIECVAPMKYSGELYVKVLS